MAAKIYPLPEDRFWTKVNKRGPLPDQCPELGPCWVWTGGVTGNGYGAFWINRGQEGSHRMAWMFQQGEIPAGLSVLHKCDNPLCVRSTHLFLGTVQDNSNDMVRKGRSASGDRHCSRLYPDKIPRGETSGMSKLTDDDVRAIRTRFNLLRDAFAEIGRDYGVSECTIGCIVKRKTWKHVV